MPSIRFPLTKVPLPMDSENVNRVSLAALGSILFAMLLVAFSNLVLSPNTPAVPGFALPTSAPASTTAAAPAAPEEPLAALLAKADAKKANKTPTAARPVIILRRERVPRLGLRYGASPEGPSRRSQASPI